MHEYQITQSLVDLANQEALKAGAVEIVRVHIRIGDISSYSEESIQYYWAQFSQGTLAEDAELSFHREKGRYICQGCEFKFPSMDLEAICPQCGCMSLEPLSGSQTYLEAIDVHPMEYADSLPNW
jgi:hydrogenase nickel incorporation protein HypA/HybF